MYVYKSMSLSPSLYIYIFLLLLLFSYFRIYIYIHIYIYIYIYFFFLAGQFFKNNTVYRNEAWWRAGKLTNSWQWCLALRVCYATCGYGCKSHVFERIVFYIVIVVAVVDTNHPFSKNKQAS